MNPVFYMAALANAWCPFNVYAIKTFYMTWRNDMYW